MFDHLEAGDASSAGVPFQERVADPPQVILGGEVGAEGHRAVRLDLALGLAQDLVGEIDEHGAPVERAAEGGRGGDTVAAAEVAPDGRLADQRDGKAVADLVLDPDGGVRVAGDALLPVGPGHHSSSAMRGAFRSK